MSRFWSPIVQTLTPYVPGEQPKIANLIKLNTNENPFGPSRHVLDAIAAASGDALRLYPDPNADRLKETIARYHGIAPNEVFVGNGSDEVLAHTFMALLKHDKPLLHPDISYSFYPVYCGLYGVTSKQVPLDENMRINLADYNQDCGAIIIANPNAPTGIALTAAEIETLLQAHPDQVVVIDEAYIDFGGETVIPLIKRYPNLLVIQTLSKSRSLAGLRIGFAVGHPDLIEALDRVKNSFNSYPLDRLAIAAGVAAYEDETHFQRTTQAVMETRTNLVAGLTLLGFDVLPSATNFVFARHPRHDAAKLAADLRAKAILVRHFKQPRIDQYLRISIGTDAECEALVNALQDLIAA
ncbi:histidinol-phosphate aminotransferase [Silvimonas terrae]|uniref:Histidinol-phosphate aminotransferase n=1 Tax=Silvimonas terrae TaxID=300266 RepID=A0A840RG37_9NEIS|nr:histidinol-phosphate transaminase [Silvimonas terrae]MBB5191380.1 histidinol-phosphate aminotransferase [Silvimonas terrae]